MAYFKADLDVGTSIVNVKIEAPTVVDLTLDEDNNKIIEVIDLTTDSDDEETPNKVTKCKRDDDEDDVDEEITVLVWKRRSRT